MSKSTVLIAGLVVLFLLRLDWRLWDPGTMLAGLPGGLAFQVLICLFASALFYFFASTASEPSDEDDS